VLQGIFSDEQEGVRVDRLVHQNFMGLPDGADSAEFGHSISICIDTHE
jgi:hypothetical protein